MSKYSKVSPNVNYSENEKQVLEFWKQKDIKSKCLNQNKGGKVFSFYEGPPTANAAPHMGHVFTRALKDIFTRFRTMQGFYVPRKGGWDTHGLPVEIEVEKKLGLDGKQDIEKYGVEKFIDECKNSVWKYVDLWKQFSMNVGYFVNMEDDFYVTYYDDYIESCWWAISELYKKGLLYKGHKILPSCGRCGTAVSSHELAQGYQTKTDITAVAKFYCEELKANILAWTTTPWTLYSNIALCVNAKEEYVIIESRGERFVLAKQLVGKWFDEKQVKIVHSCKGSDLEKLKYTPLFDVANKQEKEKGYKVVCGEFVTLTDGTGVVHIAPAFGEDDNQIGKKYDLPFLQYVNLYGKFTEQVKDFAGKTVFDCNEEIVKKLKEQNKLFASQKFTHEYPHCWRCKTPIMYYARPSWFVKTTAVKDQMVKNNAEVNWIPDNIKEGRMGNFLANNIDWCLSRDRYWGTPLPVWVCDKCGEVEVVGSKAEMLKKGNIKSIKELHKPYVDEVVFNCKCGGKMHREKEVIDCWFDSGAMPFAQHHYPFENKDKFEAMFPAQFISEGIDQTRGWFYTLQALNTALFGKTPYKTCIANGLVVDEQGRKLSKSLGNYIDPMVLISQFGGDTARWHLLSCTQPYGAPFAGDKVLRESQGKLVSTLWNTYSFFVLYADIDNFDPTKYDILKCKLNIMDKWILSKLNSLILKVTKHLENYESFEASKLCETFADDLSNWYIRRCRKRFWGEGFSEDKQAAFTTLHYVLVNFCKILAPFVPFITESIYQNVVANFNKTESESIHLCKYPVEDKKFINTKLEGDMEITYNFCELGRSARSTSNIKIRQPLGKAYVTVAKSDFKLSDEFAQIIKDELNVKDLVVSKDLSSFASYSLKPQLKTIGPKYGKLLGAIQQFLQNCNAAEIVNIVRSGKTYKAQIGGQEIEFKEEDLLINISNKEGFAMASNGIYGVALDTNISTELLEEGIVREFVSCVQNLRKENGFEVIDRIKIKFNGEAAEIIKKHAEQIKKDVLAIEIEFADIKANELDLNGKKLFVEINK